MSILENMEFFFFFLRPESELELKIRQSVSIAIAIAITDLVCMSIAKMALQSLLGFFKMVCLSRR